MVYLSTQTNGSLVTLTGAANPFETSEKDNDDIFTPIREQTGYLRVIDETPDGSLLESLIPSNNISTMVTLYSGTWNSNYTTFTDSNLWWKGFLCANAYTQSWDKQKKVIEFPIKSVLGAAQDMFIPSTAAGANLTFAYLLDLLYTEMDNIAPASVMLISSFYEPYYDLWQMYLQFAAFFTESQIDNQGDSSYEIESKSYYDAISAVLQLHGLMMREYGDYLFIAHYDCPFTNLYRKTYTWQQVHTMAHTSTYVNPTSSVISVYNLLNQFDFKSTNNTNSFLQGHKNVKVSLPITDTIPLRINLPQTTEDDSTVHQISPVRNCSVFVQPHAPRSNNYETFTFRVYNANNQDVGQGNYSDMLRNSVIEIPLYTQGSTFCITGAVPCRWRTTLNGFNSAVLKNGIFMNQLYVSSATEVLPKNICYSIKSKVQYNFTSGYINIQFNNFNFELGDISSPDSQLYFGGKSVTFMMCKVRFGTKYWNGSAWTTTDQAFTITVDGTSIASNKTSAMNVLETEGYFIPVDSSLSGDIEFSIRQYATAHYVNQYQIVHSRIISDLNIQYFPTIHDTVSDRTENVYRQTLIGNGFNDEINNALEIGTINNNIKCQRLVMSSPSTFLESIQYATGSSTYFMERPEINLLNRMASHYSAIRRTMRFDGAPKIAPIPTPIPSFATQIFNTLFLYNDKYYFAIDASHNWRDDIHTIKLLEVT